MKCLDKSYKVGVTPEQSCKIQELAIPLGFEWWNSRKKVRHDGEPYLFLNSSSKDKLFGAMDDSFVFNAHTFEEIQADDLIALLTDTQATKNKETKMTNLDNFLNCKKVRCVDDNGIRDLTVGKQYGALKIYEDNVELIDDAGDEYAYDIGLFEPVIKTVEPQVEEIFKAGMKVRCVNNWCSDLTVGKEYEVLHVDEYTVHIIDDRGIECNYDIRLFEPTTKVNDGLDSMPCETVTEFEVGDKIYCNLLGCIETVEVVINDETLLSVNGRYMFVSTCCQATQENYEMLCKIFPHIHFEKPPAVLKRH